jgi:hypothetical protein
MGKGFNPSSGEAKHDDAATEPIETVRFSLDGMHYQVSLSASNAAALRAYLQPYIDAGYFVGLDYL